MSGSVIKTFAGKRLLANSLDIAVKGNSIVLETYQAPDDKIFPR